MIFDLHIHSKHSFDSLMEPFKIVELAQKRGLTCISITDHNTIRGSVEAKKYENNKLRILVGEEIATNKGDLIGIDLVREIKEENFFGALEEIKLQGGISILPHPYQGHKDIEEIAKHVDIIEAYNPRLPIELNEKARLLAKKLNKPFLAGSDAHFYREIGNCKNILNSSFSFKFASTNSQLIFASQIIKAIKTKKGKLLLFNGVRFLMNLFSSEKTLQRGGENICLNHSLLSKILNDKQ